MNTHTHPSDINRALLLASNLSYVIAFSTNNLPAQNTLSPMASQAGRKA